MTAANDDSANDACGERLLPRGWTSRDYHRDPGGHFSDHPDFATSVATALRDRTTGADFHPDLDTSHIERVSGKGEHAAAYSAFEGADDAGTLLGNWLRAHGVTSVDVAGIATDYCVQATAIDAAGQGFGTRVLLGLTAGVDSATTRQALDRMRAAGVELRRPALKSRATPRELCNLQENLGRLRRTTMRWTGCGWCRTRQTHPGQSLRNRATLGDLGQPLGEDANALVHLPVPD